MMTGPGVRGSSKSCWSAGTSACFPKLRNLICLKAWSANVVRSFASSKFICKASSVSPWHWTPRFLLASADPKTPWEAQLRKCSNISPSTDSLLRLLFKRESHKIVATKTIPNCHSVMATKTNTSPGRRLRRENTAGICFAFHSLPFHVCAHHNAKRWHDVLDKCCRDTSNFSIKVGFWPVLYVGKCCPCISSLGCLQIHFRSHMHMSTLVPKPSSALLISTLHRYHIDFRRTSVKKYSPL